MILKTLIIEDDTEHSDSVKSACKRISKECGFTITDESLTSVYSLKEARQKLRENYFDLIIIDIDLGGDNFNIKDLDKLLSLDYLNESRILIHSACSNFYTNYRLLHEAICMGVNAVTVKGVLDCIDHIDEEETIYGRQFSFDYQLKRNLLRIRNEIILANIGRSSPKWKREKFINPEAKTNTNDLWKKVQQGHKIEKLLLLVDISNSTDFLNAQEGKVEGREKVLQLFHEFANNSTNILEQDKYKGIIERYTGDGFFAYFDIDIDTSGKSGSIIRVLKAAKDIFDNFKNTYEDLKKTFHYKEIVKNDKVIIPSLRILVGCGEVLWIVQGVKSRPQLSVMTNFVAKFHRSFMHSIEETKEVNGNSITIQERTIEPGGIYCTEDILTSFETEKRNEGSISIIKKNDSYSVNVYDIAEIEFFPPQYQILRNYDNPHEIYKLKNIKYEEQ